MHGDINPPSDMIIPRYISTDTEPHDRTSQMTEALPAVDIHETLQVTSRGMAVRLDDQAVDNSAYSVTGTTRPPPFHERDLQYAGTSLLGIHTGVARIEPIES